MRSPKRMTDPNSIQGADETFEQALDSLDAEDPAKIRATIAASDGQKSLEKLFDYTKFHIGLYLTLTTSYVAATSVKNKEGNVLLSIDQCYFWPAVLCFIVAGLSGGVIASSITQTSARSSKAFLAQEIGPWEIRELHFKALKWTWIEHTAFWIGLGFALVSARP